MLKITLSFLTCACLMPRSLLASLSPAELGLYEETAPDALDDFTSLKQLADYIAAQSRKRNHQPYQFPFFVPHVHKKHHIDIINQRKYEILQLLKEKLHAGNLPKRHQITDWNYPHRNHHTDPGKEVVPKIVDHYLHHNLDSMLEGLDGFSGSKLLYQDDKLTKESQNYEGTNDGYSMQPKISPKQRLYNDQTQKENIDKQLLSDFFQSDVMSNNRQMPKENKHFGQLFPSTPEFTYYFDDSNSKEDFQFAVKPNDPRYYDNTVPPIDIGDNIKHQQLKISTNINRKDISMEDQSTRKYLISSKFPKNNEIENFTAYTSADMDKSEGKHPLIVPIEYDLNNDIYFIAVIAGCSAAAMFALVLISLTWCRLQRGVKAAADIEYPAYGVTGPNKDVSPSEDQRLAQSAQMYHFQHQKQQIIAMENRASATRDPGSLSEAESEEENEEGDYTVYECPGLASTGEMEVKNPLFHDDPTPMTPAQTNKEEDHI